MTTTAQEQSLEVLSRQAAETYAGSVLFMKQLTTLGISTITYLKNVFDKENFKTEHLNGVQMKILKKNCKDELAQFVSTALMQAFDAFDKKYLHKLALCFYEEEASEAENLLEYLVFEYSYTQSGVKMDVISKSRESTKKSQYTFEHVRDSMIQMIQTCKITTLERQYQVPETYDISLRLYYNDAAPEGYQAPGFLPVSEGDDHLDISEYENGRPVPMGSVQTPFHRFVAHSYARPAMPSSNDAEPSLNVPRMTQMDNFEGSTNASEQDSDGQAASSAGRGARAVICPCLNEDDDGELMLTCDICGSLQHGACFGRVLRPRRHACARCGPAPGADARLLALSDRRQESLCMVRRALWLCARRDSMDAGALRAHFGFSIENTGKLLRMLIKLGVLSDDPESMSQPRQVVPAQVEAQMSKFFYLESAVVDRLEAESQRGAARDPLGALLGPAARDTLHEDTRYGKLIEPPRQEVVDDKTLHQYKEAILSSQTMEEEDLPLRENHTPVQDMNIGKQSRKRQSGKENTPGVKTKKGRAK